MGPKVAVFPLMVHDEMTMRTGLTPLFPEGTLIPPPLDGQHALRIAVLPVIDEDVIVTVPPWT